MVRRMYLTFLKKGGLNITTNYRGLTLAMEVSKIYMLLFDWSSPVMEKLLRILTIRQVSEKWSEKI